jgi:hypothetical protein
MGSHQGLGTGDLDGGGRAVEIENKPDKIEWVSRFSTVRQDASTKRRV